MQVPGGVRSYPAPTTSHEARTIHYTGGSMVLRFRKLIAGWPQRGRRSSARALQGYGRRAALLLAVAVAVMAGKARAVQPLDHFMGYPTSRARICRWEHSGSRPRGLSVSRGLHVHTGIPALWPIQLTDQFRTANFKVLTASARAAGRQEHRRRVRREYSSAPIRRQTVPTLRQRPASRNSMHAVLRVRDGRQLFEQLSAYSENDRARGRRCTDTLIEVDPSAATRASPIRCPHHRRASTRSTSFLCYNIRLKAKLERHPAPHLPQGRGRRWRTSSRHGATT